MGQKDIPEEEGDGTPVCIKCFKPVDPLAHYCPNCGEATGQFTHYLPLESILYLHNDKKGQKDRWLSEKKAPVCKEGKNSRGRFIFLSFKIKNVCLLPRHSLKCFLSGLQAISPVNVKGVIRWPKKRRKKRSSSGVYGRRASWQR